MTKSMSSQMLIRRATLTPAILLLLFAAHLRFRWVLAVFLRHNCGFN